MGTTLIPGIKLDYFAGTELSLRSDQHRTDGQHAVLRITSLDFARAPSQHRFNNILRQNSAVYHGNFVARVRAEVLVPAEAGAFTGSGVFLQDSHRGIQGRFNCNLSRSKGLM